ncbi:transporter substrate-binding domain-containing protein [Desulfobacter sp.]|uniref:transporter substrate-binding domain-containing protein n=1 Tax=Desulfobacter sp. TaxID=2294 RepID=UPI003D0BFE49
MKSILVRIIIYLVFIFPVTTGALELTPEEKAFITSNSEVRIAMMPDFSPFSYIIQDAVGGFEHDLLALVSQKTGLTFTKQLGNWNSILTAFKTRKVDMIASISYKKEREAFTIFTKPYYEIPIIIFVRDDFGEYQGLESLAGKKVGVLKDIFYSKELEEIGSMELVPYETYEEVTQALVFGKIDALIQNLPNINHLIKKHVYTNLKLAAELQLPNIRKEDLRFGIRPDKPILRSIMQKALDSISKEEKVALVDLWIGGTQDSSASLIKVTEKEGAYLVEKKTITMCINPDQEPYEKINHPGKHEGLAADCLQLIAQKIGKPFTLLSTKTWQETLAKAKAGKCDIVSFLEPTPDRKSFLNFTSPIVENYTKAMQMVSGGELDSAITPLVGAAYIIAKERLFDIKISGDTGLKRRYTIGVKKMTLYCRELWKKRCYPCLTRRVKRSAINGSRFAWKKERTTV